MSIFSDEIINRDTDQVSGGMYLKSDDLQDAELQIIGVEAVEANDSRFGANEEDALCAKGILKVGEILQFSFVTTEQEQKVYTTKSSRFYYAFKKANLETNDWAHITRKGRGMDTEYKVVKSDHQGF